MNARITVLKPNGNVYTYGDSETIIGYGIEDGALWFKYQKSGDETIYRVKFSGTWIVEDQLQ